MSAINYFDIAIIAFLLLFLIVGIFKGFIRPMITLVGLGGAIALIYFFSDQFGQILMNSFIGGFLTEPVANMVGKLGESASLTVVESANGLVLAGTNILISDAITEALGVPSFMAVAIAANMSAGSTLGEQATLLVNKYIGIIMASLIILIGMIILIIIIKSILKRHVDFTAIKAIDKVFGGLIYLVVGAVLVFTILSLFSYILPMINHPVVDEIEAMMVKEKSLTPYLVQYNPITMIINMIAGK